MKIDHKGAVNGLRAIRLENDWLALSILPDVGAKIYELFWKPAKRQILWRNPRIAPQTYSVDANLENYWCGGWDDGFPTCDACDFRGERYPLLGELRSLTWNIESMGMDTGNGTVKLSAFGPISPMQALKTVPLVADSPTVCVRFEVKNLGPLPIHFMWGTHPALEINDKMILRIPARTRIVGHSTAPQVGVAGQHYSWPNLETPNGVTDMSCVQGIDAKVACGHYAVDLEEGWYAVEDTATHKGFLLQFPVETCPYLWLWIVYGGWRGYYHLIVEPWTSYPNNLADAHDAGRHLTLAPDKVFSVEVWATIYSLEETHQAALRRIQAMKGKPA